MFVCIYLSIDLSIYLFNLYSKLLYKYISIDFSSREKIEKFLHVNFHSNIVM